MCCGGEYIPVFRRGEKSVVNRTTPVSEPNLDRPDWFQTVVVLHPVIPVPNPRASLSLLLGWDASKLTYPKSIVSLNEVKDPRLFWLLFFTL